MGINFVHPYLLILIPVFLFIIIYTSRSLTRINRTKKRIVVILRCSVIVLLVLSICGTTFYWRMNTTTTIFIIDASNSSAKYRNTFESFIEKAVKFKTSKDKIGVISFGENAQVESFISSDPKFSKVEGEINGNYTNIENAISSAVALFPEDTNKRIVILSDGDENLGAAKKIIPSLKSQEIQLKYYGIGKTPDLPEAEVDSVKVPEKMTLGQEFDIEITAKSSMQQNATLTLYSGRKKTAQQEVKLQNGVNKFVFKDKAVSGGLKTYRAVIEPENDSEVKNNEASAFGEVKAKPQILVIEDEKGEADELVKILKASSAEYKLINAASAPSTLQEMTDYKAIITCNVAADSLNSGFMKSVESYVKDFGGGFIATGGDNSFALGGYKNTSLEKVLPVYMDMKGKKQVPKMDMILVIDKSGSMTEGEAGISKIEMAKQAAVESLKSLRSGKDELGVIAFDGGYSWVVKNRIIQDVKKTSDDIDTIRADGGTSILPALTEAYDSIKDSNAKIKHIILLTDGIAERTGYDNLLNNINKNKVTVSTVAVGQDADANLLKNIASECGGRAYVTNEYTNIPRIFSKETFMASKVYLNNREFTPVVSSINSILSGVTEDGLPTLLGYVGASSKENARVLLKSDTGDPILSIWQYGLGKTVAWNSDVSGKWNANYAGWHKNQKLWQNIINFTVANYSSSEANIGVETQGQKAEVTFTNKKNGSNVDTIATVVDPSGKSKKVKMYETAPGQYTASIKLDKTGVYMINGKQLKNGEVVSSINTGYAMQYSPEYKMSTKSNFSKLVMAANGRIVKAPKEIFTKDIVRKNGDVELTSRLLSVALILLMLDIAYRRLNINIYALKLNKLRFVIEPIQNALSDAKIDINGSKSDKHKRKIYEKSEIDFPKEEEDNQKDDILDTSKLLRNRRRK